VKVSFPRLGQIQCSLWTGHCQIIYSLIQLLAIDFKEMFSFKFHCTWELQYQVTHLLAYSLMHVLSVKPFMCQIQWIFNSQNNNFCSFALDLAHEMVSILTPYTFCCSDGAQDFHERFQVFISLAVSVSLVGLFYLDISLGCHYYLSITH